MAPFSENVVVLGAGVAGLSVACAAAEAGYQVLVLEQNPALGAGSSGRNAGLGRQAVFHPALIHLAAESLDRYRALQGGDDGDLLLTRGSWLLDADGTQLDLLAASLTAAGIDHHRQATPHLPHLARAPSHQALFTPRDATLDSGAILETLRRRLLHLGGHLHLAVQALAIDRASDGSVSAVRTAPTSAASARLPNPTPDRAPDGSVSAVRTDTTVHPATHVVDARGPWAGTALPGFQPSLPALAPRRRHLILCSLTPGPATPPLPTRQNPWVWDLRTPGAYLRPEPGGILACICDVEDVLPHQDQSRPEALDWLAERWAQHFPALAQLQVRTFWAGLRTFAPDNAFVLGPDPKTPGFHWAAAYGGHGMTAALAAAYAVLHGIQHGSLPEPYLPLGTGRFLSE